MNTDHLDSQSQSQDQRVSTNTCMDEGDWNTATFGGRDDNVEDSSRFNEVDSCMRGADRNSEGRSKELQFEAELQERILNDKEEVKDGIIRNILGFDLPLWVVGFQIGLGDASERIEDMIEAEWDAKVWNYTKAEGGPPKNMDPAFASNSPEVVNVGKGFDFVAANCEGLVLSPALFAVFLKYADPLFDDQKDIEDRQIRKEERLARAKALGMSDVVKDETEMVVEELSSLQVLSREEELLEKLSNMRLKTQKRLDQLDEKLKTD